MSDDSDRYPKHRPAARAAPSYLRLLRSDASGPHAEHVPAEAARTRRARPGADAAMAELAELARTSCGAVLARLCLPGRSDLWWAGDASGAPLPPPTGSRALQHFLESDDADIVADLRLDPRFAAVAPEGLYAWCRTIACVPVAGPGGQAGSLAVFLDAPGGLTDPQRQSLARLAALASTLEAETARRREAARQRAQERRLERTLARQRASTRRALSRSLHEDVANRIAGTALLVQSLVNRARGVPEDVRLDLKGVSRELHAALAQCRTIACANHAYLIEAHGLAQALTMVLRGRRGPSGGRVGVVAEPHAGHDLGATKALCVLEMATTAVEMAAGLRRTQRITVRLRALARGGVRLCVAADSAWITTDPYAAPAMGWEALRYLARRSGADVSTTTDVSGGHRLAVAWRRIARRERPG